MVLRGFRFGRESLAWMLSLTVLLCASTGVLASDKKTANTKNNLGDPLLLNELLVNPNGSDSNCEYAEIKGAASSSLNGIFWVAIEGDGTSSVGAADRVVDLSASTIGSNGFLVITTDGAGDCTRDYNVPGTTRVQISESSVAENGTTSFALISSPTTPLVQGTDYDTNNDGTLDGLPGDAVIIDGIGNMDTGESDTAYFAVFSPPDGSFGADMLTRFPGNTSTTDVSAWYGGDMDGDNTSVMYDTDQVSDNFPMGGMLTPGAENVGMAAPSGPTDVDFDGDGMTDYGIVRTPSEALAMGSQFKSISERLEPSTDRFTNNKEIAQRSRGKTSSFTGVPTPGTGLEWWIDNSSDGSTTFADFGSPQANTLTPADFDGDGRSDIAFWQSFSEGNPSGNAFFFVMNSSDSTVSTIDFGQTGDTATVVADYDGDGMADPAVYRCAGPPFGPCTFFYQGSAGSGITFVPFGNDVNDDVRFYPGDFDGDGTADIAVYRRAPGSTSTGQYVILRSSDQNIEYVNFGIQNISSGDILAPGDYDGDGMTDFANIRVNSGAVEWWILERDGGFAQANWGTTLIAGTAEFLAHGDYDGDGATDIAIWRRNNTDPNDSNYFVRRSSDGALQSFEWGAPGDSPINAWNAQ